MPPESTVRGWVVDNVDGFSAQYARARDIGLDCSADEIRERVRTGTDVQRDRLVFDAERWYLSKLAPKKYGDRLQQEITGPIPTDDKPLNHEEMARRLLFVLDDMTYKAAKEKAAKMKAAEKEDVTKENTTNELKVPPSPPTLPWCDPDE